MLENIRIVLVSTTDQRNIGSAARAMKTMGLSQMVLVNPQDPPQGKAQALGEDLRVEIHILHPGDEQEQKLRLVRQLGSEVTVSIGNGSNDAAMLKESGLGICMLGPEGASSETMANSDLVISDINAALDLLLKPGRLIATLRR